jgi:hypothetical protein
MIRDIIKENGIYDINTFNYVINPQINKLANSNLESFQDNFKDIIKINYKTVASNLDTIRFIKEGEKFYFNENFEIQVHSNYFGYTWPISIYRYTIGLGRGSTFNDLKTFMKKIKSLFNKSYLIEENKWNDIPKIKMKILKNKYLNIKNGLLRIKRTYEDDNEIKNIIDEFIKNIESFN